MGEYRLNELCGTSELLLLWSPTPERSILLRRSKSQKLPCTGTSNGCFTHRCACHRNCLHMNWHTQDNQTEKVYMPHLTGCSDSQSDLSAPVSSVHQLDHRRVLVFWLRFGEKIFIKLLQHYKLNFHLIQWLNGSPVKVRKRITLQHVANADQEVRHDRGRMSNGWIFRFIECHWRDLTASRILQILQSFTLKMFPRRYFQRSGD